MDYNKITGMPSKDILIKMYRDIRTIRRFEEVGMDMYRQEYIRGYFHTCIGEEGVAAGACGALRSDDYIVSTHRGHGHCIAKGADLKKMMAELFGKNTGYSKGRGGSMHIADRSTGNIGANGIVGGGIPLAAGVGMGIKLENSDRVVVCFFGDGAVNNGVFAESINLAAIYTLPVIFVLENNSYAATTHISETSLSEQLAPRVAGYGVEGKTISGNDPLDIYNAVGTAVEKARAGGGPTLVEAMTYRYFGHHINDPGNYVPMDTVAEWKSRDPMDIMKKHLVNSGIENNVIETINDEIEKEIKAAVIFAKQSPEPDVDEFIENICEYEL